MGRGDHLRASRVDGCMQHERGSVHGPIADHYLAGVVHQQQVADAHAVERQGEGIHPEVIRKLRITGGDVAGHAFPEPHPAEDAQSSSQAFLAMAPFGRNITEAGWREITQRLRGESDPIDRAGHVWIGHGCCAADTMLSTLPPPRFDPPTQLRRVYPTTAPAPCGPYNRCTYWSCHDLGTGRSTDRRHP